MAYESLKQEIRQYIKTNGQNEITGQILQDVLIDMVNQYPSLDGYATQQWVLDKNYVTSAVLANYLPLSAGQNNALTGDLYVGANSIHLDYNTNAGSAYSNISHEKIVVGSTVNIINGEFTATINNDGTIRLHSVQEVLDERTERVTILKPGEITVGGQIIGASFYKIGGTSSEFLKADGSVDSNTYLTSLAVAGLSDVVLTNLTNGQALVYDSTDSKWKNVTIQAGGSGTVTSVATGTGLSGGPITTSGTISISSTYQTYISHGESAYNSLSNYLPMNGGGTITNANDYSLSLSEKAITFLYGNTGSGSISLINTIDGAVFSASSNFTINGNTIWHAGNFTPSNYLPLSAGSTKALTGDLYVGGYKIQLDGSSVSMFYLDKTKLLLDDVVSSYYAMELTKSSLEFRYRPALQVAYKTTTITPSSITSPSFIKTGGTSSQFLKADGSVDSNTYITSSGSCNYAATAGSATYVTCPYSGYPNDIITDSTTSESLSKASNGTLFPVFHSTDWGYSDTLYWSGYGKWGGTELATKYDSASAVRVKIRKYNQSLNGWGAWTEIITDGNIASYLGSNLVTSVCGYNGAVSKAELEQGLGLSSYVKPTIVDALADGVLIVYDSGGWITKSGSTYLSSYATKSWVGQNYLPLSAGISYPLTGDLYVGGNKIQLDSSSVSMFYLDKTKLLFDDVVSSYYAMELTKSSLEFRYRPALQVAYKTTTITSSSITSPQFVKTGGTSSQFLKADGSVDSNTYALSSSLSSYLPLSGGTLSGILTIAPPASSGYQDALVLHDNGSGADEGARIRFTSASYTTGITLGPNSDKTALLINGTDIVATRTWVGQNYLPLSAGISYPLTGDLYVGGNVIAYDTIKIKNVLSSMEYLYSITADDNGMKFSNIGNHGADDFTFDGDVYATNLYQNGNAVRTSNDTYISGNTIYVGNDSLTVSSGGGGTVTSVATGTGLTGGTITTSGTIKINSTYQTYISHGESAYNSLSSYLPLSGGNMTGAIYDNHGRTLVSGVSSSYILYGSGNSNTTILYGGTVYICNYNGSEIRASFVSTGVGIGVSSPSYKLHVNGDVAATSFVNTSDVRRKDIMDYYVEPSFENVANAPAIRFRWNQDSGIDDNYKVHVGSIAQYWQTILPEAVTKDNQGYLSLQYDVIALLSAISVAKRVTEHERRIEALERENAMLRLELNQIKSAA